MLWAYPATPYKEQKVKQDGEVERGFFGALWESINLWDFMKEFGRASKTISKEAVKRKGQGDENAAKRKRNKLKKKRRP